MDVEDVLVIIIIMDDLLQAESDAEEPVRQIYNAADPFVTMNQDQFTSLFWDIWDLVTSYMRQEQTYYSFEIKTKVRHFPYKTWINSIKFIWGQTLA